MLQGPQINDPVRAQPGFCELLCSCQLFELTKRVAHVAVDCIFFLGKCILYPPYWVARQVIQCCCRPRDPVQGGDNGGGVQGGQGGNGGDRVQGGQGGNDENRLQGVINRIRGIEFGLAEPEERVDEPPVVHQRQAEGPTLHERADEIFQGDATTEELRQLRSFCIGDEFSAINLAIARRELREQLRREQLAPQEPLEGPAPRRAQNNDFDVELDVELRGPAPIPAPIPAPVVGVDAQAIEEPEEDAAEPGVAAPRPLDEPANAGVAAAVPSNDLAANRTHALARIVELKGAIDAQVAILRLDQENALRELAERETGTPPGTLAQATPDLLVRLSRMPVRVGGNVNMQRHNLWPEGVRAADKLAELKRTQESREKALLRLAQIKILGSRYSVQDEIFQFDLDQVLATYRKDHPCTILLQWYDFAYRRNEDGAPNRALFSAALNRYFGHREEGGTYQLANEYLSYIHSLLIKKHDSLTQNAAQINSPEAQSFKDTVRTFIRQLVDANRDCVDQMNSQLEDLLLNLVAEDQSSRRGPEAQLKFKAGLALCQHRAKLITSFTDALNPDRFNEPHLADLERVVKQKLADLLGLQGRAFQAGAYYANLLQNVNEKAEKVGQAVFISFNAPLFLIDEVGSSNNSFPATFYLRTQLTQHIAEGLDLANMDDDAPLPQALALDKSDAAGAAAYEGGALTFEGTIYYLETAGLLIPNRA